MDPEKVKKYRESLGYNPYLKQTVSAPLGNREIIRADKLCEWWDCSRAAMIRECINRAWRAEWDKRKAREDLAEEPEEAPEMLDPEPYEPEPEDDEG